MILTILLVVGLSVIASLSGLGCGWLLIRFFDDFSEDEDDLEV